MSDEDAQGRWINFQQVSLLVLDQSAHGCKILSQIVRGFGIRRVVACTSVSEARHMLTTRTFDLMIADPAVEGDEGIVLMRWLRREEKNKNRFVPIILISGHATSTIVRYARDCGANFFIAKPLTARTLLDRILWVARDKRPFVQVGDYLGPDRRFKVDGPPDGNSGRRENDAKTQAADAEAWEPAE
jgi:CheY-like chemotaxis protein